MRKYILMVLLLSCATGASAQCSSTSYSGGWICDQGAAAFQNSNSGVVSVTTSIITAVANGDLIIAVSDSCASTGCNVNRNQTVTITDNASNSYTCPISNPAVSFGSFFAGAVACYVCKSAGGPTQFTATNSDTVNGAFTRLVVTTWHNTGSFATSCLDQKSSATFTTGSGTSAAISTTSNTTANNDLIYSVIGGVSAPGVNNSFVIAQQTSDTVLSGEAKNGATAGSYPTGWTGFSSGPWLGMEFAFFAPASSSGVPRKHGTFITFKPYRSHRLPWIYRRDELRIETT